MKRKLSSASEIHVRAFEITVCGCNDLAPLLSSSYHKHSLQGLTDLIAVELNEALNKT